MATLIKNGTVVTAVDQFKGDILIEGEKFIAIGRGLDDRAVIFVRYNG